MGPHCPVDLQTSREPYLVRLSRSYDDEGHERGERINGFDQCPKCGLWWLCIEEPDCWEEDGLNENGDVMWKATGWWGAAVCEECNLLMVDQPDGTAECYHLSSK